MSGSIYVGSVNVILASHMWEEVDGGTQIYGQSAVQQPREVVGNVLTII